MEKLFLSILNLSVTAGWIVLGVIILRFFLKKAPKWISCLLWGIVGIRLIMPFSFKSFLSLIPSAETFPQELVTTQNSYYHTIDSGINAVDKAITPIIRDTSPSAIVSYISIFSVVWLIGIAVMQIYSLAAYLLLKRQVRQSVPYSDNIRISGKINSPFILGFIRPKIYLPNGIPDNEKDYIIAHEKAHLKRLDHLIKPFAFTLLSVYWFNPLLWLGYLLLCRDIELACDQKVIKGMKKTERQEYSVVLLQNSIKRPIISACPLAFGEVGVKKRIKGIMNYKKPAFWIIISAIVISLVASVCLLTAPPNALNYDYKIIDGYTEHPKIDVKITDLRLISDEPYINIKIINNTDKEIVYGDEFHLYLKRAIGRKDCCNGNHIWNSIAHSFEGKAGERKINLTTYDTEKLGKYQLEFPFTVGNDYKTKYMATVEFERISQKPLNGTYEADSIIYDNPILSYNKTSVVDLPLYEFVSNSFFTINKYALNSSVTGHIGDLTSIKLTSKNFDKLFLGTDQGFTEYSPRTLRKNNESAWEIKNTAENTSENMVESFFILLRQSDSSLYICHGTGEGKDKSIHFAVKLKEYEEIEISPDDHSTTLASVNLTDDLKQKFYKQSVSSKYSYSSSMNPINIIKIDSQKELKKFKKDFYPLLSSKAYLEGEQDFLSAISECDEEFFETNSLLLTYIFSGSIDYRYESSGIYCDRNQFKINFVMTSPPSGDTAVADWIAVTKIKKKIIQNCEIFDAEIVFSEIYTSYEYVSENGDKATLVLGKDKTFTFSFSQFSSYIAIGSYKNDGDKIILYDKDKKENVYRFKNVNGKFIFLADESAVLPKYRYNAESKSVSPVPDRAKFVMKP